MPQAAILGAWIRIQPCAYALRCGFVLCLARLFEQNQQQIAGKHVVQCVEFTFDSAISIEVIVDPTLNVIEILLVGCSLVYQILSIKIESYGIAPFPELDRVGLAMHGVDNDTLRPIDGFTSAPRFILAEPTARSYDSSTEGQLYAHFHYASPVGLFMELPTQVF